MVTAMVSPSARPSPSRTAPINPERRQLRQIDRGADAERNGEAHGEERRDQGAVDERQSPEALDYRIPVGGDDEAPAEVLDRGKRLVDEGADDADHDQDEHTHTAANDSGEDQVAPDASSGAHQKDARERQPFGDPSPAHAAFDHISGRPAAASPGG